MSREPGRVGPVFRSVTLPREHRADTARLACFAMPDQPRFVLSQHATVALRERRIDPAWIESTVNNPDQVEQDRIDPNLLHALKVIPQYGNRVLRVVYNPKVNPARIVTAYFDRAMKGKL